jgi:hypothetical protein
MTDDQIAAKYRLIADAIDAGQKVEFRESSTQSWKLFNESGLFNPGWELRLKESEPEPNPHYIVGWIGNNGTSTVDGQVWVWRNRKRADCCKGHKPLAVVTPEVVEALESWIDYHEGIGVMAVDRRLLDALNHNQKGGEA